MIRPSKPLTLRYEDQTLTASAVRLSPADIRLPEPSQRTMAIVRRTVEDRDEDQYLLFIECWQWARNAVPNTLQLRILLPDNASLIEPRAFIEVDNHAQVVRRSWAERPYHVPVRWFLVEYRCPKGSVAVDLTVGDEHQPLPALVELPLSSETLAALSAATKKTEGHGR
jgi:hypothetical protein